MKNILKGMIIALLCMGAASGCMKTHKNLYYWGEYEHILHDIYVNPGKADLNVQIEKLNADIQESESYNLSTPPGIYAHLGFIYASQGDSDRAIKAFNNEKKLFPESAIFIDGLMKRAFKKG